MSSLGDRWRGGVESEAARAATSTGPVPATVTTRESELTQGTRPIWPLRSSHAVGASEAKGDDGGGRHGPALYAADPPPNCGRAVARRLVLTARRCRSASVASQW